MINQTGAKIHIVLLLPTLYREQGLDYEQLAAKIEQPSLYYFGLNRFFQRSNNQRGSDVSKFRRPL
jgi:hypothetical protein